MSAPAGGRRLTCVSAVGVGPEYCFHIPPQYNRAYVTCAPGGRFTTEVERALTFEMFDAARAVPAAGSSARQKMSAELAAASLGMPEQLMFALAGNTTSGGPPWQSSAMELPTTTKSPCCSAW